MSSEESFLGLISCDLMKQVIVVLKRSRPLHHHDLSSTSSSPSTWSSSVLVYVRGVGRSQKAHRGSFVAVLAVHRSVGPSGWLGFLILPVQLFFVMHRPLLLITIADLLTLRLMLFARSLTR